LFLARDLRLDLHKLLDAGAGELRAEQLVHLEYAGGAGHPDADEDRLFLPRQDFDGIDRFGGDRVDVAVMAVVVPELVLPCAMSSASLTRSMPASMVSGIQSLWWTAIQWRTSETTDGQLFLRVYVR